MPEVNEPRSSVPDPASSVPYEQLSARGKDALRRGDFVTALAAFSDAREQAAKSDDPIRVESAELNRAMVLIQMGEAQAGEEGLRKILLRTSDARTAFTAAYNLASSLRKQGRYERAMTYARRAMDRARELNAQDLEAGTRNLFGNILLNQTYLDEALAEYETALALQSMRQDDNRYSVAILEENIGYCLLLKKRFAEGFRHIRRALRLAEEVGDRRCRTECLQDLCYGHLLLGQHDEAARNGEEALADAAAAGYRDLEENCHYLLGELGNRTGDDEGRDRHFARLQALHPELPFLKDFLCSVDVTSIITLKR